MSEDKIVDLIGQLLGESDLEKQKAILAQLSSLLAEEREQHKKKGQGIVRVTLPAAKII